MRRLGFREQVAAEQEVTRRYGWFMPGLMIVTIAAGFAAAGLVDDGRGLILGASACYAAMLAITLAGNVPINVRTLRFPADGEPAEWRALRRRWDRLHTVRVALDVAGFALLLAATL